MAQVITRLVNASTSVLARRRGALVNVKVTFSAWDKRKRERERTREREKETERDKERESGNMRTRCCSNVSIQ